MSQKVLPFELPTGEGAPKNWGLGVDVFIAIQRATLARCGQEPAVLFSPCFSMVSAYRNRLAELTTLGQSVVSSTLQIKFFLGQWIEGDIFGGGLDEFCGHTYEKI